MCLHYTCHPLQLVVMELTAYLDERAYQEAQDLVVSLVKVVLMAVVGCLASQDREEYQESLAQMVPLEEMVLMEYLELRLVWDTFYDYSACKCMTETPLYCLRDSYSVPSRVFLVQEV